MKNKEKEKVRRKSLGMRVTIYILFLGFVSILGIYLNKGALEDIKGRAGRYDEYFTIQALNKQISVAYTEVQIYANLLYFTQDDRVIEKYNTALATLDQKKKELISISTELMSVSGNNLDTELISAMNVWLGNVQEFEDAISSASAALVKGDSNTMMQFMNKIRDYRENIGEHESKYEELISTRIERLRNRVHIKILGTNIFINVLIIINITLVVIIVVLLYRQLVKPAKESQEKCTEIVNKIQAGNGDLTERVPVKANDEVGALSNGINEMIGQLQNIIKMLGNEASILKGVSEVVADNIQKSESEISNVSSIMEEISASSEETSSALTQMTAEVNSINQLVDGVFEKANSQATLTEEILHRVSDIRKNAMLERDMSDQTAKQIVESLENSIQSAKKVSGINTLVDDILNISSQTNLLALNASIEAARAGDVGKGFAVVADEISKLANNSAGVATHIQEVAEEVIKAVNDLTEKANQMIHTLLEVNMSGRKEISSITDSYCCDIDHISKSMNEFADTSRQVQNAMNTIKGAIASINFAAEETAKGISNATASTIDITQSMTSIEKEAQKNLEISNTLYGEVSKFKI